MATRSRPTSERDEHGTTMTQDTTTQDLFDAGADDEALALGDYAR